MKDKTLEIILKEIKERETISGEKVKLSPLVDIFYNFDHRSKLNHARDYIWFGEDY